MGLGCFGPRSDSSSGSSPGLLLNSSDATSRLVVVSMSEGVVVVVLQNVRQFEKLVHASLEVAICHYHSGRYTSEEKR